MKIHPQGAEEPSGARQYKSPSTTEYVTDAQYITELVVSRKALKDKVVLTYKYWNNKEDKYAKYFRSQITKVHQLLKKYDVKALIQALNKIPWCNSVFPGFFHKEVEKQQSIIDNALKVIESKPPIEISEEIKIGSNNIAKKSKLSFLKEFNNETDDSIPVQF